MSRWTVSVTCLSILQICSVSGQNIMKSSLALVLDSTGSLEPELYQLNNNVDRMFSYVKKNSPIENFVLVSFNDPTAELLTVTNDREEFKKYSKNIIPAYGGSGGDCPEYALTGINIALQNSLDFSTLYVITDATASDFNMYDEVRNMAIKKQIQINFITTGDCESKNTNGFQVYYKLAKDTVGEVFPIIKSKVSDILEYMMESIKSRRYLMAYEILPSAHSYKLKYTVDSQIDDVIISITGSNLDKNDIRTTIPDGNDAITSSIFLNEKVMIIRLLESQIGVFVTEINSDSQIYVKVTGNSNINFKCGFSSVPPSSPIDTATRPAAVGNAYLSIQLYAEGINLTTARVLDMNENTLEVLSLRTPSEDQNFFVSKSFDPPRTMFRIAVDGYDIKTNTTVSRKSAIPFERRNPKEKRGVIPIKITIEGWPKIITKYNVTYQLKCKAEGYPTPLISWHEKESGKILPAEFLPIEEPIEFISILNIGEPIKNASYECRARSLSDNATKDIQIEVDKYFRVVQATEGCMDVEYEKEISLLCKIDALPSATIIWYKDKSIITGDSNTVISSDNSSVTIKQMNFKTKGMYSCEARHDLVTRVFNSTLFLAEIGIGRPIITNNQTELHVFNGNDVELKCQINAEVNPKATIMWRCPQQSCEVYEEKNETSNTLYLRNVTGDYTGSYSCIASNYMGTDFYDIDLIVDYPPMSNKDVAPIIVKAGTVVNIPCDVYGEPSPKIDWSRNNSSIKTTNNIIITSKNNLRFINIQHNEAGNYTCIARNKYGSLEKTFNVEVYKKCKPTLYTLYTNSPAAPISIRIPDISAQNVEVNQILILTCDAYGYPKPEIKWIYNDYHGKLRMQKLRFDKMSKCYFIQALKVKDEGYYTCIASNKYDSSRLTYQITVDEPPAIRSFYPDNSFNTVVGDMTLIIHCVATGRPAPEILWFRNNTRIALGNEEYDGKDGYLVIKNVSKTAQGDYSCRAQNKIGNSSLDFKVVVKDYPDSDVLNDTIILTSGESQQLHCKVDLKKTDRIRWYKNKQLLPNHNEIENSNLELKNVSESDSGIYGCHFHNMSMSYTLFYEVIILEDNGIKIQNQADSSNHR